MAKANATISFVQTLMPPPVLKWVNTGRVSDDWKAKIFQHDQSGRQFAIYDRTTICVLFEHDVPEIMGVVRQEKKRPRCDALNDSDSKFASTPGSYYKIDTLSTLELVIRSYLTDAPSPSLSTDLGLLSTDFEQQVATALADSVAARRERLQHANRIPRKIFVQTSAFVRNPDVVAEVLLRASGYCEICHGIAPFKKVSNGQPYLEVHHTVSLASGGEDVVENAVAACPNCHRQAHFG
jgi:hypothetical protein